MASTGNRSIPSTPSSSNTHKVLSLNSKTKKVTVSSYKPAQQQPTPPSTTPTPEDQAEREKLEPIPPPPSEIEHAKGKPPANRPFFNLRAPLPLTYISAKGKETSKESQRGGNKRKNERRRSSTLSKPQNVRPGAPSSQEQTSST
ncbi:hypothetical protein FRC03_012282 [Tulasnella sp. 419]|nr:hypothetical protein FRC03_012282 [Tulasnella sp. 419]